MSEDQREKSFVIPPEITVELKVPLKKAADGGTMLDVLTFRPPTVGQVKQVSQRAKSQGEESAGILLLSICSVDKLSPVEIEGMNALDFQICSEALQPFLRLKPLSAPGD
jgi:hypothetical protein